MPWQLAPQRTSPPLRRAAPMIHDATSDLRSHSQRPLMPSSPSRTPRTKEPKSENSPPMVGATQPLELQSHAKRAQNGLLCVTVQPPAQTETPKRPPPRTRHPNGSSSWCLRVLVSSCCSFLLPGARQHDQGQRSSREARGRVRRDRTPRHQDTKTQRHQEEKARIRATQACGCRAAKATGSP